ASASNERRERDGSRRMSGRRAFTSARGSTSGGGAGRSADGPGGAPAPTRRTPTCFVGAGGGGALPPGGGGRGEGGGGARRGAGGGSGDGAAGLRQGGGSGAAPRPRQPERIGHIAGVELDAAFGQRTNDRPGEIGLHRSSSRRIASVSTCRSSPSGTFPRVMRN